MRSDTLTAGPITIASIEGDFYGAVHQRLAELGLPWSDLAGALGTSRQNLERALRKQRALRLENVRRVIAGLAKLQPSRKPRPLAEELDELGLTVTSAISEDDAAALLDAIALTKHRARKR